MFAEVNIYIKYKMHTSIILWHIIYTYDSLVRHSDLCNLVYCHTFGFGLCSFHLHIGTPGLYTLLLYKKNKMVW